MSSSTKRLGLGSLSCKVKKFTQRGIYGGSRNGRMIPMIHNLYITYQDSHKIIPAVSPVAVLATNVNASECKFWGNTHGAEKFENKGRRSCDELFPPGCYFSWNKVSVKITDWRKVMTVWGKPDSTFVVENEILAWYAIPIFLYFNGESSIISYNAEDWCPRVVFSNQRHRLICCAKSANLKPKREAFNICWLIFRNMIQLRSGFNK